jgi:CBS domain containing-hemolysin-like protein
MLYAVLIVLTLLLSAFFSASEIAFVTVNRLRVEVLARRGGVVGPIVQRFLKEPATLLTTTLVGNNLSLVVYSTLLAVYLQEPLSRFAGETLGMSQPGAEALILLAQTVIGSAVVLVIGEIIPKSVVREVATRAVFALAIPLRITYFLLLPLIKVAGWTASLLIRFVRADADTFSQFMRRDFELMIEESKKSGELDLDEEESELLSNVFAMGSIRVKESMVPRTDIVAVEVSTPIEDLRQVFVRSGHSKLPVYRDNIDRIVGMAFAYDLFSEPASVESMMRDVRFVPDTKLSKDLLREFLAANTSIAIVIDEYGGTAGIVTTEDLLEELFGDIQDEFDNEIEEMRRLDDDTIVVSGRVDIDELEEKLGWTLPEGDYETVAGYLLDRLGTIPAVRDEVLVDGIRFTILQATANRIELVRARREPAQA